MSGEAHSSFLMEAKEALLLATAVVIIGEHGDFMSIVKERRQLTGAPGGYTLEE